MNILTAAAVYKNDVSLPNGLTLLHLEIPPAPKSKQKPIPIFLQQGYNLQTTFAGVFEKGTNLLVQAKIYPNADPNGSMYAVPTTELQKIPTEIYINQAFLAGGVGYVNHKYVVKLKKDCTEFGLMCKGSDNPTIGYNKNQGLKFQLESWNSDARFLKHYLYEGRSVAMAGPLKFETYVDKEGQKQSKYKVSVRYQQYQFFGKNKEDEQANKEIIETVKEIVQEAKPVQSPKSVNWQSSPVVPENDDVPF